MQTGNNSSDLLDSLKCPITYELFRDPVIAADGHTYERENITVWIKKHASSPITREPIDLNTLRSNYIVKKMVEDFVSLSLQKQYRFRLDTDVCIAKPRPLFQSSGKTIYEAKWMLKHGPSIVLIRIDGAKAKHEASFYVKLSCHPHIVRTYGLVDNNSVDSIMLVQEYAPEGDLNELLRRNHFQPSFEILIEIFWQIADAMKCLADNEIIHGDLACRNVLVFRSSSHQSSDILVKLTDFGLTRTSSLFSVIDTPVSTTLKMIPIRYAAPELLLDASPSSYSEKSDVYSFGVLMWEACSGGAIPYGNLKSTDHVYEEKLKGKLLERPNICSNELWNIILNCTQQEVQQRPIFKDVQEALCRLRFQNNRQYYNIISQIDRTSNNISNRTLPINNTSDETYYGSFDDDDWPSINSHHEKQTDVSVYQNLPNVSNEYVVTHPSIPTGDYYIPCEYCLQSINNDDVDVHKDVCKIRRLVQSFARMVAQLPLLEITLCQYCEYIIPLNMLHIHQNTCGKNSICLHHTSTVSPQLSINNYIDPVSLPNTPNVHVTTIASDQHKENRTFDYFIPSETSNQSLLPDEYTTITAKKPPKTGFRKAFSKFKKKISP